MKNLRLFFTLSSSLIIAASVYGVSANAKQSNLEQCIAGGLSKAECACEIALQDGTKKALRDFLKLYRNADTACNALASTAEFTENSNGGPPGSSGGPPGSNGGPPSVSGANPGNFKNVGHAGEDPSGHGFGSGDKGKSQ